MTKSRAVGRAHLASLLLQKGWVSSFKDAFEKYLSEGKPGYASKFQQTPFEAIDLIRHAGGVPVLAHPMLNNKDEIIPALVKSGLLGIEVYYPHCSENIRNFYLKIAEKHHLVVTGGSDAHGNAKKNTFVGKQKVPYENVEQIKQAASFVG